jgi:hypothetical protein
MSCASNLLRQLRGAVGFAAASSPDDPHILFASSKQSPANHKLFLNVTADVNKAVYAPRVDEDGPRT